MHSASFDAPSKRTEYALVVARGCLTALGPGEAGVDRGRAVLLGT